MRWLLVCIALGGFVLFDVVAAIALFNMLGWSNVPYDILLGGLVLGIGALAGGLIGLRYTLQPNIKR